MRLEKKLEPLTQYPLEDSSVGRLLSIAATHQLYGKDIELTKNDLRELGEMAKYRRDMDYESCIFQAGTSVFQRFGYAMPWFTSPEFTTVTNKYELLSHLTTRSRFHEAKDDVDKGLRTSINAFWKDKNAQESAKNQSIQVQLIGREDLNILNSYAEPGFEYAMFKKKTDEGLAVKEYQRLLRILKPSKKDLDAIGRVSKTQLSEEDLFRYAFKYYYPAMFESGMDAYEFNRENSRHMLKTWIGDEEVSRKLGGPLNEMLMDVILVDGVGMKLDFLERDMSQGKRSVREVLDSRIMDLQQIEQKREDLHESDEKDRASVLGIRGANEASNGEVRIQTVRDNLEGEFGRQTPMGNRRPIKAHYQRYPESLQYIRTMKKSRKLIQPFLNLTTALDLDPEEIIGNFK